MLDCSCHPPLPLAGAYRFAPDPISKRKRKKIAENPQDKPLRAVVRFAILGVSPSDILGFSAANLSRDRGRMGGMAVGIGWPPPGGHGQGPLKTLIEGWARHGQENYYAPTAGAEETGGRGLATTHTGKG